MIYTFGNQKGGSGKSTLAILFANYLAKEKNKNIIVFDFDYQKSIFKKYEAAKLINDTPELYGVMEVELVQFPYLLEQLAKVDDQDFIIDLPGKLDDNDLVPVLESTDVFIIPFAYEEMSFQATVTFTIIAEHFTKQHGEKNAKMFFVPGRISKSVKYELAESIHSEFRRYGTVTEPFHEKVCFQRITTKDLTREQLEGIRPIFEEILKI
ncbi:MAG: ParA family protein [Prolixibacteraceae bacterium]|nr:ParA family protein [Prolixibacteraceae bacterium]